MPNGVLELTTKHPILSNLCQALIPTTDIFKVRVFYDITALQGMS